MGFGAHVYTHIVPCGVDPINIVELHQVRMRAVADHQFVWVTGNAVKLKVVSLLLRTVIN